MGTRNLEMSVRVACRFQKEADNTADARSNARKLTTPINQPKGISKEIVRTNGDTMDDGNSETIDPHKRDIRPKDVFNPSPNNTGVRNFAETGKDLQKAIDNQVPKDKGYATVKNLSQYLIETGGGGGTKPQGR